MVPLAALRGAESKLIVAVLKSSEQPAAAGDFARYMAGREHGLVYFRKFGFGVIEGGR